MQPADSLGIRGSFDDLAYAFSVLYVLYFGIYVSVYVLYFYVFLYFSMFRSYDSSKMEPSKSENWNEGLGEVGVKMKD